jgi:hypothetical protein
MTSEHALKPLARLVGTWATEATHPAFPGVIVHGTVAIDWLEGERFLIQRSRTDHPDFPDAISIIGFTDRDRVEGGAGSDRASVEPQLTMHYYDSRGVFRLYDFSADDASFRFQRMAPGFSQRFTGTFADGGHTIHGVSQLSRDDAHWDDDLQITYRRRT